MFFNATDEGMRQEWRRRRRQPIGETGCGAWTPLRTPLLAGREHGALKNVNNFQDRHLARIRVRLRESAGEDVQNSEWR